MLGLVVVVAIVALIIWFVKTKVASFQLRKEDLAQHLQYYNTKDANADIKTMREQRKKHYLDLVKNYYNLTTDMFHLIWGPHYSMGIVFPQENRGWMSYPQCQTMYQSYLAHALQINENSVIADFGCGTGGPTRCVAQFTGCKIKAVNINEKHLAQMKRWNEEAKIDHRIELICSDYHKTPIPSDSLDGLFMCESAAHSPDYLTLCKEVFRVLKPGARYAGFDWQMTDRFDESNAEHRRIRHLLEYGVGVCVLRTQGEFKQALLDAGFEVVHVRCHSEWCEKLGGKPWNYVFEENSLSLQVIFSSMTTAISLSLAGMEKLGFVPQDTRKAYDDLMVALKEGMQLGGRHRIFSPMMAWIAIKPKK